MNIIKAKHSGFCFGVKRAVEMAQKALEEKNNNIYLVGEIVHNKTVINELESMGLKSTVSIDQVPDNATILLKAHGSPPSDYQKAKNNNLNIIDATCPMVTDIHRKAKRLEENKFQVIVFGDKDHEEVIGICGQIKDPIVVRTKKDIENIQLEQRVALVCQSTQKIDDILEACAIIEKKVSEFHFENTLCQTTKLRQKETKQLASTSDAVIVVGSKNSANTKHLFEESSKINSQTYWIETYTELENIPLGSINTVALISGASTPEASITEIAEHLKNI